MIFHNYQDQPIDFNTASPNLLELQEYHLKRWGGMGLGIFGKRDVRGEIGIKSTHWSGAAWDIRYISPGPGRAVCLGEIIPFYIDNCELLHVQAIHDYYGRRIWRVNRPSGISGWIAQNKMTGAGGGWLHIETHPDGFHDTTPVELRITDGGDPSGWQPFIPESGQFSLWPYNEHKPVLRLGATGDAVRYLQGIMHFKLGWNIPIDGQFGKITELHVQLLQGQNGKTTDGVVGPITWGIVDWAAFNL